MDFLKILIQTGSRNLLKKSFTLSHQPNMYVFAPLFFRSVFATLLKDPILVQETKLNKTKRFFVTLYYSTLWYIKPLRFIVSHMELRRDSVELVLRVRNNHFNLWRKSLNMSNLVPGDCHT